MIFLAAPAIFSAIGRAGNMAAPASVSDTWWQGGARGGKGFIFARLGDTYKILVKYAASNGS